MSKRIGPQMQRAINIVANNPGCCKCFVADKIGPHGSRKYGYAAIDRAISAGLIRASRVRGIYSLEVVK